MIKTKPNQPRRVMRLTTLLALAFFSLSAVVLLVNGAFALYTNINTFQQSLSAQQQLIARDAGKSVSTFVQGKFDSMETAVALAYPIDASAETQQAMLGGLLGHDPAFKEFALLDSQGRQLAQISRTSQTLSPQFIAQLKSAASAQTTQEGRYVGPVYIDDVSSEPLITISIPVKNVFGEFRGTLVADVNLKFMWDLVSQLRVGQTGYVYVVDNHGNLIAFEDTSRVLRGENVQQIGEVGEFIQNPTASSDLTPGVNNYNGLLGSGVVGTYVPLGTPPWAVVVELPQTEAYQPLITTTVVLVTSILILVILSGIIGVFVARRMALSLVGLTQTATRIAGGELQLQAEVSGPQEVQSLATAFNTMTTQLSESIEALDLRVVERTKALTTSADVSRRISTILDLNQLVVEVVNQVQAAFGYYYVQIYFADPATGDMVLTGGTGDAGQTMLANHHRVQKGKGLVGRAAETDAPVLVSDVTQDPNWLPNPLLPDTRSELAVPMTFADQVIGVFDVQSDIVGRFTEADTSVQSTLASQIAVAVQNARQNEDTQTALVQMETLFDASRRLSMAADVQELVAIAIKTLKIPAINRAVLGVFSYNVADEIDGMTIIANWWSGDGRPATPVGRYYTMDEVRTISVFTSPTPNFFNNMRHDERLDSATLELAERLNIYSMAGLPLYLGTRQVGVLELETEDAYSFDQEDIRLLTALAPQLAIVLENRRQYEQAERQAKRETTLNLIGQKIQSTTRVEDALQIVARELGQALGMKPTRISLDPTAISGDGKEKKENA